MNSAILVRQHTTTRIMSCPLDKGSPSMKSIKIESQGCFPIRRNLWGPKACDGETFCNSRLNTNDVVGDEGNHSGPVELMMNVLDHLGNAWVSSQVMVVVGVEDIQSDVLIVRDIEQSFMVKEVTTF